eukprot:696713-Amphidinium_carterae.1
MPSNSGVNDSLRFRTILAIAPRSTMVKNDAMREAFPTGIALHATLRESFAWIPVLFSVLQA